MDFIRGILIAFLFLCCVKRSICVPVTVVEERNDIKTSTASSIVFDDSVTNGPKENLSHIMKIPRDNENPKLGDSVSSELKTMVQGIQKNESVITTEVTKGEPSSTENSPVRMPLKGDSLTPKPTDASGTTTKLSGSETALSLVGSSLPTNIPSLVEQQTESENIIHQVRAKAKYLITTTKPHDMEISTTSLPQNDDVTTSRAENTTRLELSSYLQKLNLQREIIGMLGSLENSNNNTNSSTGNNSSSITVVLNEKQYSANKILNLLDVILENINGKSNTTHNITTIQSLNVQFEGRNYSLSEIEDLELLLMKDAVNKIRLPDLPLENFVPVLQEAFGEKFNEICQSIIKPANYTDLRSNMRVSEETGKGSTALLGGVQLPEEQPLSDEARSSAIISSRSYSYITLVTIIVLLI